MSERSVRVLVVDDSAFMRRALTTLINAGRDLEVIGTATNGREALEQVRALRPDVVTMDVEMPEMDGLQALEALMRRSPVPVVMLSSLTRHGADTTLRCLELGAVDFIAKPTGSVSEDLSSIRYLLWQKVRAAASAHVSAPLAMAGAAVPKAVAAGPAIPARQVVAIGASTGGPRALQEVLMGLPGTLNAAVLVVQHMPPTFTAAMAQRFDSVCALTVREAAEGDRLLQGTVLIAPGGRHLRLHATGTVYLTDGPPIWGVRPAVDPLVTDVARLTGMRMLGVILTGMGRDGADGLCALRAAGGTVFAQDEASCVVYGMPRAAVMAGAVDTILPLDAMAEAITSWCATGRNR